jgi:hypothetical protein
VLAQVVASFPADFPPSPIAFQEYDTATGVFTPLRYAGDWTLGPHATYTTTGPTYWPPNSTFPYIQLDTATRLVILGPGTFVKRTSAAIVSVGIPAAGTYQISGDFARANDSQNAGDGVRVAVFVNNQVAAPQYEAVISSNHAVDPSNVFGGTGKASFSFQLPLARGSTVQFAVFSGPGNLDGTFDETALRFSVAGQARTIKLPEDFPPQAITFEQYNTDSAAFQPLRYAGEPIDVSNGSVVNTGPLYTSPVDFFPYALLDLARNTFYLHPGTFTTRKIGAVITVGVPDAGVYHVSGAFARGNDFVNAGDGVRVLAFINDQIIAPQYDAVISSNHSHDANRPFEGTGTAPFTFAVPLARGDKIRFAVFSGPTLADGTFDVTALRFAVTTGAPACIYSTTPTSHSFNSPGGSGQFAVATTSGCPWNAASSVPWLTLKSPAGGIGPGVVTYEVSPNASTTTRTGALVVAAKTHFVTQYGIASEPCTFVIKPSSQTFTDAGGAGTIDVASGRDCAWTATSSRPWITITRGGSGRGNGSVQFYVQPNPGDPRTAAINIADKRFLVQQTAYACGAIDVTSKIEYGRGAQFCLDLFCYNEVLELSTKNKSSTSLSSPLYLITDGLPKTDNYSTCGVSYLTVGYSGLTFCGTPMGSNLVLLPQPPLLPFRSTSNFIVIGCTRPLIYPSFTPRFFSGTPSR